MSELLKKITDLTAGTPADTDVIPYVDLVAGATKKALKSELKGDKGDTGTAATVDAGTTTTGVAGSDASVVNSGTTSAAVFDFTIPRGDKGEKGDTGTAGADGQSCNWKGAWVTSTAYVLQDIVSINSAAYVCVTAHTSGTFATDLAAGKWEIACKGIYWRGAYDNGTAYVLNDGVSYNGSSYICTADTTGNLPTDTSYWNVLAARGSDGTGSGDISGSGVANELAYFTAEKTIDNLAVATYPSLTEVSYVKGVTSAIQTQFTGKVDKSTYDAHSVLYATTDNTPVALTVGEQTVVGRATGGNISAIAIDSDLSSVSANDDTIPSAKATKAMGDTKLALAGGTMTGDIQLGETDIKLDAVLSGDETWSGIVTAGTAGATLAVGDVCYLATSGKWLLNDGILDGTDTGFSKQLGICVLAANDTQATEILLYGKIRSAAFPSFTVGAAVYLDDTAGDLVVAQPTTTNFAIRKVGYALTAEDLMFNPSNDFIVHV